MSRQFTDLTRDEVADLCNAMVRALQAELANLGVAVASEAERWAIAVQLRHAVTHAHWNAWRRAARAGRLGHAMDPPESIAGDPVALEVWKVVLPAALQSDAFDLEPIDILNFELFCGFAARAMRAVREGTEFISMVQLKEHAAQLLVTDETMRKLFGDRW